MSRSDDVELSQMINEAASGSPAARNQLISAVYNTLRAAARRQIASEPADHTLSATALVHEAYLKLAGPRKIPWQDRGHFYAAAAEAMRRVLLDHAKGKRRLKRGSGAGHEVVSLDEARAFLAKQSSSTETELIALDEAIHRLTERDQRAADVVRLKYYAGLTSGEIALALGVSERTVKNDWAFAKAWLQRELVRGTGAE